MNSKILSISIAAYNVSECLDNAMASLIKDEALLQDIEIIIVNDGSKDQTSQIAHNYESRYPEAVVVIDKSNGGYGSTINSSLAVAKGKYYKLLDGDDWYCSENLCGFVDYLRNSTADLIVTPYYKVKNEGEILADDHPEIGNETCDLSLSPLQGYTFLMHEIAIKTEVLKALNKPIAEKCFYTDLEYVFYAVACANSVARYALPIYCYRLGVEGQSVSLTGIRKHYKDYSIVARRMFAFYEHETEKIKGSKKMILDKAACDYTYHTYRAYTLLENPKAMKKELVAFDQEIKKDYPKAYSLGFNSKLVRHLRKSRFLLYPVICRMSKA